MEQTDFFMLRTEQNRIDLHKFYVSLFTYDVKISE